MTIIEGKTDDRANNPSDDAAAAKDEPRNTDDDISSKSSKDKSLVDRRWLRPARMDEVP